MPSLKCKAEGGGRGFRLEEAGPTQLWTIKAMKSHVVSHQ